MGLVVREHMTVRGESGVGIRTTVEALSGLTVSDSVGDNVVAILLHFLPHLQCFFFDATPLRCIAQSAHIDVGSGSEFSEEKSDANSGVDGVLD